MTGRTEIVGRLVLADRVAHGRVVVANEAIGSVEVSDRAPIDDPSVPLVVPGFIDLHVHGWAGNDAMDGPGALAGMARALARRGVTSFLPTAISDTLERLGRFADEVRAWMPLAPDDGAAPLGFNLEGPFLSPERAGAHDHARLLDPAAVSSAQLEPLLDGLRLITIAPERPGALELIRHLSARGIAVSLGHSAATFPEASAGYAAGATSTTHLFNGMTGLDHRAPGLAAAALLDDRVCVELVADGHHVDPALWGLVRACKPVDRLVLVSDAGALGGTTARRGRLGDRDVEVVDGRAVIAGTTTLAGSVIALDDAVRNLVRHGADLAAAVAAATGNPATLIGATDRGRIDAGQRADLVELDADLSVRRVMIGGRWLDDGRG